MSRRSASYIPFVLRATSTRRRRRSRSVSAEKASLLGAIDETRHRRLVQTKVVGQLAHLEPSVPKDREHPKLGQERSCSAPILFSTAIVTNDVLYQGVDQISLIDRGQLSRRVGGRHVESPTCFGW